MTTALRITSPLIVFPDTHGHLREVEAILAYCRAHGYLADRRCVFLGDYVDRGPHIRELLDFCIAMQRDGHLFIAGNHEYALTMAMHEHPLRTQWITRWAERYENGTLASYGVPRPKRDTPAGWRRAADALRTAMPETHRTFIRTLPFFVETEDAILIHAGIESEIPWATQRAMLQERREMGLRGPSQLFSHALAETITHPADAVVVSGHATRTRPYASRKRVLLSCGVDVGGPLVAWISDLGKFITTASIPAARTTQKRHTP